MKKLAKTVGTLSLAGCAVMNSPSALADDSGWYVGASIGQSRAKIDDARITTLLVAPPMTAASISDDDRDTAYKLFGGYKFNKNFALEGGYFDLGQFGFTATTVPLATLTGNIKLKGINLDAVGILPITEKFSAFCRVGLHYAEARDSFAGTGSVIVLIPNPSKRETNYKAGLGFQYDFTESLGVRVEAERYRINDAIGNKGDIDLISLGLVYRFGAGTAAPVRKAAVPEPVADVPTPKMAIAMLPPPPKPVAIVTPPPPPPPPEPAPAPAPLKKVIFSADSSADSLFDFDKADIKPAGQQALDKFAADLRGANFELVTVTGHSDRVGQPEYNMRLSERRAIVVKAYLEEFTSIPADKITAKGVGESDPVTKPGECTSEKTTEDLIACLQPDRRVEVEVSATRVSQ